MPQSWLLLSAPVAERGSLQTSPPMRLLPLTLLLAACATQAPEASRDRDGGGGAIVSGGADAIPGTAVAYGPRPWPAHPDTLPPAAFSLDTLQHRTFRYFWELSDGFGQIPDRWPTERFSSIAATGFGLPALAVGVERGYVTRAEAAQRARRTLQFLWDAPQGPDPSGTIGHKGYFYHFLNHSDGLRYGNTELSTIDTGLLIAGVLAAGEYFDADTDDERAIRELADALYRRVEWDFAWIADENVLSMGWKPGEDFIRARWRGYNEASVLLILAMGSPTHPIPETAWDTWTKTYDLGTGYGAEEHVMFDPLFGHQYSQMFVDFRGLRDDYLRAHPNLGDYFENSVRASDLQLRYARQNPLGFTGYSDTFWGLTACDGPGGEGLPGGKLAVTPGTGEAPRGQRGGDSVRVRRYWARGVDGDVIRDDGTLSPTAAGGSFPFTPEASERALAAMWTDYQPWLVGRYGLRDAFNLEAPPREDQPGAPAWFNDDYLGIDQGPIVLQIENHRTGMVWDLLKSNPHVRRGLRRAGFTGGWLDDLGSVTKDTEQ